MVPRPRRVIAAGSCTVIDPSMLRAVRKSAGNRSDRRFIFISLFSIAVHGLFVFYIGKKEIPPPETRVIEEVPERFARLIVEKPIPKTEAMKRSVEKTPVEGRASKSEEAGPKSQSGAPVTEKQRTQARRAVDARVARVERKLRTVGVLGMLTGVGPTAKGPSVVDVLGSLKERRREEIDLEAALDKMTGLQKTTQVDVLDRKLVKSKDVAISHKEDIDDLLANVGAPTTVDLAKKGSFIIQKPQSIEGAASSNSKRDNEAINAVVSSHKASIRMSYEKFLRRDPTLAGKIVARFTIAASGSVASVAIVENSTGNDDFEKEIVRKIRMWQFESITEGDVTVTYPFVFAPAG